MGHKIKSKTNKMKAVTAIKTLFADLITNATTAVEYKMQMENLFYVFRFSFVRVEDENGKVYTTDELKKMGKTEVPSEETIN